MHKLLGSFPVLLTDSYIVNKFNMLSLPFMTSCLFFSLGVIDFNTFSSTLLVQSGGSGSASVSESSNRGGMLLGVRVTDTESWALCCVAVTMSKAALGLSRLLGKWKFCYVYILRKVLSDGEDIEKAWSSMEINWKF